LRISCDGGERKEEDMGQDERRRNEKKGNRWKNDLRVERRG
jgi:hypothetical protein